MDIQQIRTDFDSGVSICRAAVGELIAHAEQAGAVLAGRQQKIGELNMRIAELEARPVAVPRVPSNPAAHDWAAPAATVAPVMQAGVLAGWKLVPIEPDEDMVFNATHINNSLDIDEMRSILRAGIAAAPSAPVSAQGPVKGAFFNTGGGVTLCQYGVEELSFGYAGRLYTAPQAVAAPEKITVGTHALSKEYTEGWNDCIDEHAITQPIAAPADPHWYDSPQTALGGKTAREGYAANPDYASQQPLPAQSIDGQQFHELAMDYRGAPIGRGQAEYEALIEYVDTWAARLSPAAPTDDTAEKALKWFSVLTKCSALLDMPDDQPITDAAEVLAARLSQPRALSDEQILGIMSKHWEHQWGDGESRYIRFKYADMVPAVRAILAVEVGK